MFSLFFPFRTGALAGPVVDLLVLFIQAKRKCGVAEIRLQLGLSSWLIAPSVLLYRVELSFIVSLCILL